MHTDLFFHIIFVLENISLIFDIKKIWFSLIFQLTEVCFPAWAGVERDKSDVFVMAVLILLLSFPRS